MKQFTMSSRDELGNAIPVFDDAGQCEMNIGLQKAMNRLADLEDEVERSEARVVSDVDIGVLHEMIDWYMNCDTDDTRFMVTNQLIGVVTLLMARWSKDDK